MSILHGNRQSEEVSRVRTYEAKRQNEVLLILLLDEVMEKPCRNVDVNNLVCNNDHPLIYLI